MARRLARAAISGKGWEWQGIWPVMSCLGWKYRRCGVTMRRPGEVVRGERRTAAESHVISSEKSTRRLVSKPVASAWVNFSACVHLLGSVSIPGALLAMHCCSLPMPAGPSNRPEAFLTLKNRINRSGKSAGSEGVRSQRAGGQWQLASWHEID